MPIAAMAARCAAAGAEIFVDAVQAAGCLPLDVRGVDYLAAGAHKWLMGALGAGFLYVRPERAAALVPRTAGWLSHEDPVRFLVEGPGLVRYDRPIRRRADLVEGGGMPEAPLAGLLASLEILLALGRAGHRRPRGGLPRPARARSSWRGGSASLRAPAAGAAVRDPLAGAAAGVDRGGAGPRAAARGVACATPDGVLRFSPHWPNDPAEIPGCSRRWTGRCGRSARAEGAGLAPMPLT